MPTTAKIIADSISESGQRITTMVLEYPRIIHSEFMTHRIFSRNASSSRAIPVEKQIERIENDPFIPVHWGANQKGMQAYEEVSIERRGALKETWLKAAKSATFFAKGFAIDGLHKQLANRLLEPFSHIQVVVTATEWGNFFAQRLHPAAQPEIQELARVMKEAMDNSTPNKLEVNQWHLPFISEVDYTLAKKYLLEKTNFDVRTSRVNEVLLAVSVARCARVSYGLNDRGWGDIEKDLALYDMLASQYHMSPFEHIATPMSSSASRNPDEWEVGVTHLHRELGICSANFSGWLQFRQVFEQS